MAGTLTAPENGSNPSAPSAGNRTLYAKSDGWYQIDSAGVASKIGSAAISGAFTLSDDISPTQITSNQNDYNPTGLSGANVLRLSSDAARDITGLQGGSDGRVFFVHNVGSFAITLKDESVSSTAANRFALYADITLQPDTAVIIQYDSTSSRWRAVNLASVGGGSFNSFTVAGDGGSPQTITDGNTLTISGGTSLTATASATDTVTIDHDTSGVTAATYGAAATVPVLTVNGGGHLTSVTDTAIAINASAVTSGTLAVARGGTNSGTELNNNRVMQSSGGAIVEAAAITASRALKSDANGIPVHFDTASEPSLTELSYVKGVTSALQTQINGKAASSHNHAASDVNSGTLAVARGGTNSGTELNNNRVMQSSGGAIVEAAAITASRALKSDANGIPIHFDTATEPSLTELSYVKGVTSALQTQINGKAASSHNHAASDVNSGTFAEARGGTNQSTYTQGDILYASAANTLSKLAIGANTYVLTSNGTVPTWAAGGSGSSKIVQVVNTQTGAVSTTTTSLPYDNTIPQNTEGGEFMTLAITPTNVNNKLIIDVVTNLYYLTSEAQVSAALFQDSTANALAAATLYMLAGTICQVSFRHYMTAGTTSATTFKVRAGANGATVTFNGANGSGRFGGVFASSITITEVLA